MRWTVLLGLLACNNSGSLPSVDKVGEDDTSAPDDSGHVDTQIPDDTAPDSGETGDTGEPPPDPMVVIPDLVVDCEGSADFSSIQSAIDAAQSGDIIGVMACTYKERLDFRGKTLHIYGIDGAEATILDGEFGGTLLNVEAGEGPGTRVAGFTLTGGYDEANGSVVELYGSNLELEDVVITGNGKGMEIIESLSGWLDLTRVTITGNDVQSEGKAIVSDSGGSFTADGLVLDCDNATAALYGHVSLNIDRSTITCATGYGIWNYHGELWLQRSTVTGGLAGVYSYDTESTPEEPDYPSERNYVYNSVIGGGLIGLQVLYMDVQVVNSVLWGTDSAMSMTACNTASYATNSVFLNAACGITGDQPLTHRYNAFFGNVADGCGLSITPGVSADPLFTSFPDDLSLQAGSPLIDAGDPAARYQDIDGSRNDMGRFGGTWGD